MAKKKTVSSLDIVKFAVKGIEEKKGENIVVINLKKLKNAICDYYVICNGNNERQLEAIATSVEEVVRKNLKQKPFHQEGKENMEWVLIDYFDVVVHIFKPETREFYGLEDLWADGELLNIENLA